MLEIFECDGIWWLPQSPDKKFYGFLKSENNRYILELKGIFNNDYFPRETNENIILGETIDRKLITLYQSNIKFYNNQQSQYSVNYIFVGYHFEKEKNIKVESISISFNNLYRWISINAFKRKVKDDETFILKYKPMKEIKCKIDSFDLCLRNDLNYSETWHGKYSLNVKTKMELLFQKLKPLNFVLTNVIDNIINFFHIILRDSVHPISINGQITDKDKSIPISIHYATPNIKIFSPGYKTDFLFYYKDISKKFSTYLDNWFKKAESLKIFFELYFVTYYPPIQYSNYHFLTLAQALEVYPKLIEKCDYKFINSLQYISESLRNIDYIKNNMTKKVKESIVHIRNFLTHHYNNKCNNTTIADKDIIDLITKMDNIIIIILLKEMGFSYIMINKKII